MENLLRRFDFSALTGRSRIRTAPRPTDKGGPKIDSADESTTPAVESALAERRIAALRSMFPALFSWVATRSQLAVAREVHDYLAQATNVADLEQRIRVVEQQRHFS